MGLCDVFYSAKLFADMGNVAAISDADCNFTCKDAISSVKGDAVKRELGHLLQSIGYCMKYALAINTGDVYRGLEIMGAMKFPGCSDDTFTMACFKLCSHFTGTVVQFKAVFTFRQITKDIVAWNRMAT